MGGGGTVYGGKHGTKCESRGAERAVGFFAKEEQAEQQAMAQHEDLVSMLDIRQCWALNANSEHPLTNCISAEMRMLPDRVLQSDCDEELLIHIVFVQKVRLSGIQLKAPSSNGPKSVKLIVNTPSLDFDSCQRRSSNPS